MVSFIDFIVNQMPLILIDNPFSILTERHVTTHRLIVKDVTVLYILC